MQEKVEKSDPPKAKQTRDEISQVKKELKKRSKNELINYVINLANKIDELKKELEECSKK